MFIDNNCEVITQDGWKKINDINNQDKIFGLNKDLQTGGFSDVVDAGVRREKKLGFNLLGRRADVNLACDQPFLFYNQRMEIQINLPNYILDGKINYGLMNSPVKPVINNNELTDEELFRISFQADGSIIYYQPTNGKKYKQSGTYELSKERKMKRLEHILNKNNIRYAKVPVKTKVQHTQLYKYLVIPTNKELLTKTFKDWVNLTNYNQSLAKDFIEEAMQWDGTDNRERGRNSLAWVNTDFDNVEIIHMLGIMAGYRVIRSVTKFDNHWLDCYRLHMIEGVQTGLTLTKTTLANHLLFRDIETELPFIYVRNGDKTCLFLNDKNLILPKMLIDRKYVNN
jgi:hypothetical protein